MPSYEDILEDWFLYLKSKGIAKRQSNADGSLAYIRQPETSDITSFLINLGFERTAIRSALQAAGQPQDIPKPQDTTAVEPEQQVPQNAPPEDAQTSSNLESGAEVEFPGVRNVKFQWNGAQWKLINVKSGKASKIANREVASVLTKMATGVDPSMKELLDARKKLKLFASVEFNGNLLAEDFNSSTYSEVQIKKIFQALTSTASADESDEPSPEEEEDRKISEINKIKSSIRDKFSDSHRKALWRILSNA